MATPTEPIVLCAADDHYIKPLAVTLRSAASSLKSGNHLHVILMDGGISEPNFARLTESLQGLPISINVMTINRDEVSDLGVSHHITHTAYFRLLAGRLLPPSVEKVIYLDSDVLVLGDLNELWNLPLDDQYCLAAYDIACPFVDAYEGLKQRPEIKNSIPYYAAISPIANWRQLGIDGSQHYFNSGVMVLNIDRWRREAIDEKLLACLRENPTFVWCWDQYALNVVFAGQWKSLPQRWNQGAHIFEYPDAASSPLSAEEFDQAKNTPALIHFTTEFKPWKYEPFHPLRHRFFEELDQTAWTGWRPEKPAFSLKRRWDLLAVALIKIGTFSYRKLKLRFR
jgi:lipopolysaccharide biosynthesis glycosyltransferase